MKVIRLGVGIILLLGCFVWWVPFFLVGLALCFTVALWPLGVTLIGIGAMPFSVVMRHHARSK